nr:hypothetical protein [Tanacetum cinerariifolium]
PVCRYSLRPNTGKEVLSDGDSEEFVRAIGYVAKARGMSNVAQATGLGRA